MSSAGKGGVFSRGAPSFDSPRERLDKEWRGGKRKMSPEGRRERTFPVGREHLYREAPERGRVPDETEGLVRLEASIEEGGAGGGLGFRGCHLGGTPSAHGGAHACCLINGFWVEVPN